MRARPLGDSGLTLIEDFLSPAECELLIEKARPRLKRSRAVGANENVVNRVRTSSQAIVFDEQDQDPRILPILERAAQVSGLPWFHAEDLYCVRYGEGEHYAYHSDYFLPERHPDFLEPEGNRMQTILVYLNDLPRSAGGATHFEKLDLAVQPRRGLAVHWVNVDPDGTLHPEFRHCARPVAPGSGAEKWVLNLWLRERPAFTPRPEGGHSR